MKAKKITKKLSINKLTVSNLSGIKGGNVEPMALSIAVYSCPLNTQCHEVGCI